MRVVRICLDLTSYMTFTEVPIGCPLRLVVSEKTLAQSSVEWKERSTHDTKLISFTDIVSYVETFIR